MPETPNSHDIQDDERIDRVLRDAGVRMRAATETAPPPVMSLTGARGTPRRWIVPVAIVTATAAAVVAAVWIAGPATETVREAPADTGVVSTPVSAVDSLPAVAPIDSSEPSETAAPASTAPAVAGDPDQPVVAITEADFDQAGGMCVQLVSEMGSADACLTNRQLQDIPTWTVAFAEQAFEVTLGRLDPEGISVTAIDEVCGYAPSTLIPARWLNTSCSTEQSLEHFWFVAAPRTPGGEQATYVVPPRTGDPVVLQPIASALPDGFVAYRASYEEIVGYQCLVVASFPDPWREACSYGGDFPRVLVPAAGTVFLIEPAPDLTSVEVTDIAVLSVPIAGCTAPVLDMAAAVPETSVMIDGLICSGDSVMITVPPVLLRHGPPDGLGYPLERADDGTWSTSGGGTSFTCPHDSIQSACEALGVDDDVDLTFAPLPVPPWGLIGAREHDLDPLEATTDIREITGGARSPDEIAAAVIARYDMRTPGDGREPVVESYDALGLVVVELTLLDDSTTQVRYAVWYRTTESGELRVERAYQINVCGRGIAAPDMCV
ncbi:MAG TPA: hypothetical protein VNO51_09405 [Ilumatobacteraceae bacterium]|nr:hypothetical protein [Ilumatobacteraceae bacterium]